MWSKNIVHWEDRQKHYYSIVFTWELWEWCQSAQPEFDGKQIVIGGPAVKLHPEWVPDWIEVGPDVWGSPALTLHNPFATRTSTGCPRHCAFCAIPSIEGKLNELYVWQNRPVIIDNNLLACSVHHFDAVIDWLKAWPWCDFNQGLDVRLMRKHHADRIAELNSPVVRLSFDHVSVESDFMRSFELLRNAGIPKNQIRVYVLIGYDDTPEDALYRLELIRALGIRPFPMRYQSLDSKAKNQYVGSAWAQAELIRFMSYWSNFRFTSHILFAEYQPHTYKIEQKELDTLGGV